MTPLLNKTVEKIDRWANFFLALRLLIWIVWGALTVYVVQTFLLDNNILNEAPLMIGIRFVIGLSIPVVGYFAANVICKHLHVEVEPAILDDFWKFGSSREHFIFLLRYEHRTDEKWDALNRLYEDLATEENS